MMRNLGYVHMIRELINNMLNCQYGPDRIGKDGKINYLLNATKAKFCLAKALITNVISYFKINLRKIQNF